MAELSLPAELENYLRDGKQFDYASSRVEFGELRLKSFAELASGEIEVSLYGTPLEQADPHTGEPGWYVVPAVVLTEPCAEYPDAQMLWLPSENLYGMYDLEHQILQAFPNAVWSDIAGDPVRYLNASWDLETQLLTYLDPSSRYPFKSYDE